MNIRVTNSTITRKLTKIENAVKNKLFKFYNQKIRPESLLPIESIRRKYEGQVKTIIRKTIQDAYLTGTDIVAESIIEKNREFQVFISQTDIQNIASLTEKLNNQFWTTTGKLVRREQEFVLTADKQLEKKKSFDAEAAIIGLAVSFSFIPYNNAVVSKLQVLPTLTAPITETGNFDLDINFDIVRLDELPLEGRVMFLTQEDAKVDELICEPLNRTVYDINDPDIPIPIVDTHLHCRCRLVPIVDETSAVV